MYTPEMKVTANIFLKTLNTRYFAKCLPYLFPLAFTAIFNLYFVVLEAEI